MKAIKLSQIGQIARPYQWETYAVKNCLRFDTNTLPSPPPSIKRTIKGLVSINEYSDPAYRRLKTQIAAYERVPEEMITVTNSGDEAIDILAKTFLDPGDRFVVTPPTYEMFTIQCRINRGIVYEIPLAPKTFAVDAAAIIRASKKLRTKLIFLVNPNNPTGSVITRLTVTDIVSRSSCAVVVDEAYGEFYGKTVVPLTKKYNNLIVLKTFSKFAGLAGARIGYLIANPTLSRVFDAIRFPMGVSTLSANLAEQVLNNDQPWIEKQILMIKTERKKLAKALRTLGLSAYPSEANFLLVDVGNRAGSVAAKLAARGVIVRDRSTKPYLNGCIRITVRSPKENTTLIKVLEKIL